MIEQDLGDLGVVGQPPGPLHGTVQVDVGVAQVRAEPLPIVTSAVSSWVVDANPSAKSSQAVRQLAERIIGAGDEEVEDSAPQKKSLLGGFDFKSLLKKKEPAAEKAEAE